MIFLDIEPVKVQLEIASDPAFGKLANKSLLLYYIKVVKIHPIIYLVVGVVLIFGLFTLFKPQNKTAQPNPSTAASSSSVPANSGKTFELVVKDKKLISGPETLTVTEGDDVTIKILADQGEEFHLHGYDKSIDLENGKTVELKFNATLTGRFPYELEESKVDLGVLEVAPK